MEFLSSFTSLFSTWDLSAKTLICFTCGFACGLSYYVIGKLYLNIKLYNIYIQ